MSKILKNVTASPIFVSDTGVSIPASSQYTIPPQDYLIWAASDDIVTFVGDEDIVVNDGSFDLSISDGIDLIKGLFPSRVQILPTSTQIAYNEVTSVASGADTEVISYTALTDVYLLAADVAGTNIAKYCVKLNGTIMDQSYTNFGASLSYRFDFSQGLLVEMGDIVTVEVLHNRPTSGDFNAKLALISA